MYAVLAFVCYVDDGRCILFFPVFACYFQKLFSWQLLEQNVSP